MTRGVGYMWPHMEAREDKAPLVVVGFGSAGRGRVWWGGWDRARLCVVGASDWWVSPGRVGGCFLLVGIGGRVTHLSAK